jgi:hypothetical protein
LTRAAVALLALCAAGCGGFHAQVAGGGRVLGNVLAIYSVQPDSSSPAAQALSRGERLAVAAAHGRIGRFTVTFGLVDARSGRPGNTAQAVRGALSDGKVVAVIADADRITVPLLNASGVLQVAPAGDLALGRDPQLTPSGLRTLAPPAPVAVPADFAQRFRAAFGQAPSARARLGYRAMAGVLAAIARAGGRAGDRNAVRRAYFAAL